MTEHTWWFPARVRRVVDGDTIDLTFDLGFRNFSEQRVRLADVDTAEIYGTEKSSDEYERGMDQMGFVEQWFNDRNAWTNDVTSGEWPVDVTTEKATGKYGRWIAYIEGPDGDVLNDDLIEAYPEVAYDG